MSDLDIEGAGGRYKGLEVIIARTVSKIVAREFCTVQAAAYYFYERPQPVH